MENTSSSSSSAAAASSATASTATGRRRFRPSIVQWFTILALTPTSSSAREISRDSYGRKERLLPDLPVVDKLGDTEYRKQDKGFPGLVFYEDKSIGNLGLELSSNYQDETESQYDGTNAVRWQWRHKTSGYSTSGDYSCKSSKSAKSSKSTRSPTTSSQPSTSSSPTDAPSQSSSPTGSTSSSSSKSTKKSKAKSSRCAPTQSPYPSISTEPTVSDAPSGSPSFSRMPTISGAPSLSSEPSLSPSVSFMPSESSAPSRMTTTGNSGTTTGTTTTSTTTNGTGSSNTSTGTSTTSTTTNGTGSSNTSTDSTTTSADSANSEDCENIKTKNWKDDEPFFTGLDNDGIPTRTDEDAEVDLAFDISFPVSYDSADFTTEEVQTLLDNGLSVVIALWAAGCEKQAEDLFKSQAQRRLESDQLEYSEMSPYSAGAACTPEQNDSCNIFDSIIIFLFEDGADIDEDEKTALVDRIREAFEIFAPDFSDRSGLYVNSGALEIQSDDNFNKIVEEQNPVPDGSIAAGTVIGIVAAALAFILLLILLIRRRQEDGDEPSHFKLDDDADEDNEATFIREFQTDPSSEGSSPYKTRSAHVVGEADSVMSGWTGFTKHGHAVEIDDDANNTGKLGHAHGDVHMCSSATCEVCELRRRNGVQFQPTGTPPRTHLPTDASREYISEDTVEL